MARIQRLVFGEVADAYQRARPTYPAELFEAVVGIAALTPGDRVLEVGAGTGKATEGWVAEGLHVTAVEPSLAMAGVLRARFPDVVIQTSGFEECVAEPASFALVTAAQSWHWVDPVVGTTKAADSLRLGGWIALMWNRPDLDGCVWHDEIQPIYERVTPSNTHDNKKTTMEAQLERFVVQLGQSGRFGPCVTREFPWVAHYTTSEYVDLMGTYSDHRILPDETRAELHGSIAAWLDAHGGELEHPFVTELVAAQVR